MTETLKKYILPITAPVIANRNTTIRVPKSVL